MMIAGVLWFDFVMITALAVSVDEYIEQVGCTDAVPLSHTVHSVTSIGSQRADDHFNGAKGEKSEAK